MSSRRNRGYRYRVGGSLPVNHPTYVRRRADEELLAALKEGKFCYVFNCRQMGKSSLRLRTMHQLQGEGMSCASVDITGIGGGENVNQWYNGLIEELFSKFELEEQVNRQAWLRELEHISAVHKLSRFIKDVLLVHCTAEKIFIFIDEIDKVLSFKSGLDDFFALIRYCYNQRAENSAYNRLTFALFGVATPSDLIRDKTQTPFNIGHPIELTGFAPEEAAPLEVGLQGQVENPQAVLREILYWTGGQPVLTQKLCQLVVNSEVFIEAGREKLEVERLVRWEIIDNWQSHDDPEHLRTIRDRVLRNEQRAGRLLGLYRQILLSGTSDSQQEFGQESPHASLHESRHES
ncbi:MAG TPA: hypothetical protein DC064_15060, partial [Cyanobacteria bacterium UBA9273]|nr:hypothetical protein [Cyanobacteria bacterium UBA9273]